MADMIAAWPGKAPASPTSIRIWSSLCTLFSRSRTSRAPLTWAGRGEGADAGPDAHFTASRLPALHYEDELSSPSPRTAESGTTRAEKLGAASRGPAKMMWEHERVNASRRLAKKIRLNP